MAQNEYRLKPKDKGKTLEVAESSKNDETSIIIPNNENVSFEIGTKIKVYRADEKQVNIKGETGVKLESFSSSGPVFFIPKFTEVQIRKCALNQWTLDFDGALVPPIFIEGGNEIFTEVIDGHMYRIHHFNSVQSDEFEVLSGSGEFEVYMWGAGGAQGGSSGRGKVGGGGAFSYSRIKAYSGFKYLTSVGGGGIQNDTHDGGEAGGAGGTGPLVGSGGNGGASGEAGSSGAGGGGGAGTFLYFLNTKNDNIIAVAGGGGGGGGMETGEGDGRGGGGGQDGASGGPGGTGGLADSQSSFSGQDGEQPPYDASAGGGGGGGINGGGAGNYPDEDQDAGGGGGGGGSIGDEIQNGFFDKPGNEDSIFRNGAGTGGSGSDGAGDGANGLIVILYRIG